MENNARIRGRVKALKPVEGAHNFGFIIGEDKKDYFFHWTMLHKNTKTMNQIKDGDTVEFTPEKFEDKDRAQNIVVLD